jgi:imidazolonepropionase-like amidohydrolase
MGPQDSHVSTHTSGSIEVSHFAAPEDSLLKHLCLVALAFTFIAQAQQKPVIVEHGTYNVHLIEHSVGTEEYTVTELSTQRELTVSTSTNDRGMKRTTATTLSFAADYTPSKLEQHNVPIAPTTANAPPAADTGTLTEVHGTTVSAREGSTSRTLNRPAIAFTGFGNMPASVQMMMMRYWLRHGRPARLNLLRASADAPPIQIKLVGHDALPVHGETIRLTRYTIANLIFGREILWLNDSNRVAAIMTFAGGLPQEFILDQYDDSFPALFQSGVRQQMLDLADLTRAVHPLAKGTFAIVGARLIDATGAPAIEHSAVLIRDGRIVYAGAAGSAAIPSGARIIHAEGKSLLPGLWEMHVHYSGVEFGPAMLAAGITTTRDCGGEFEFLTAVRHAIDAEHQLGPRMLLAGLIDSGGPLAFGAVDVKSPADAIHVVDTYADAHFDQIKVYTQLQPDVLRAISAEAHKRGMTVTGHVPAAVNSFEGIADGMDMINHLQFVTRTMLPDGSKDPFTLATLDTDRARKLIALLVEKQIVVDPTLGWGEMAGHPKSIATETFEPGVNAAPFPLASRFRNIGTAGLDEAKFRERMDTNIKVVGALFKAGVPIVPGFDTGLIGYGLDRELELYVQAGMTPLQAIQSATIVSARVMHHDSDSGTIEVGKRADLVLIDGNPLANISDLRKVDSVVTNGTIYSSKALGHTVGFNR